MSAQPLSPAERMPDRDVRRRSVWFWAMPTIAVVVVLALMGTLVWLVHRDDVEKRRHTLIADSLWVEQTLRFQLRHNEETLASLGRAYVNGGFGTFDRRARQVLEATPELQGITLSDSAGRRLWSASFTGESSLAVGVPDSDTLRTLGHGGATLRARYSEPLAETQGGAAFAVFVPAYAADRLTVVVSGVYTVHRLLHELVPWWVAQRYHLSMLDRHGRPLGSKSGVAAAGTDLSYDIALEPPGYGVTLRATSYERVFDLAQSKLVILILGLCGLLVWSLWALRRHMVQRVRVEEALRSETVFRKAMEDSMLTGMRATDLTGRITYVNQAFCRMTGLEAAELVGRLPPMPYWPEEELDACREALSNTLAGRIPRTGFELRFKRRNGERFDVRLYVSPLIDGSGVQTGWMASMVDITEQKRSREALRASHERFVAVLEGLDAAVCVFDPGDGEILFENTRHKSGIGSDRLLSRQPEGRAEGEIIFHSQLNGRWYQVRSRPLRWVDGREAVLELATDVSEQRQAEEMKRQQMVKLQHTSRLVSMGEMASALAHELNQPLAAISGYNTGCINKLRSERFSREEIIRILEKLGSQAHRAGKIIKNIRGFVSRRDPQQELCDVNDVVQAAVSFAEIDARRQEVHIRLDLAADLPTVVADPVMIEQVVLNLLRNGVEAVQGMRKPRREVRVSTQAAPEGAGITVEDLGPGIAGEQLERIFDPFYTTKAEGMGIGLNICRSIVEYHKGRLTVDSTPGAGTRFHCVLPTQTP